MLVFKTSAFNHSATLPFAPRSDLKPGITVPSADSFAEKGADRVGCSDARRRDAERRQDVTRRRVVAGLHLRVPWRYT